MIRCFLLVELIVGSLAGQARAEDAIKIGFIAPSTGQFSQIGNQMIASAKYYLKELGTTVAGKKIELHIRDDGGQPDVAKRITQEFIVNDKVAILAGFTFTPVAMAVARPALQHRICDVSGGEGSGQGGREMVVILNRATCAHMRNGRFASWSAMFGRKGRTA